MAVSESQMRATARYQAKNYDEIKFRVKKGKRDYYKSEAAKRGLSLAAFVQTAVEKYIAEN